MKPVYNFDIQQNTDEWLSERLGLFTASSASNLLMDNKNKGYQNLTAKIFEERYTGEPCESSRFKGNADTDRGHLLEPIARQDYELNYFASVKEVGFVKLNEWCGCSPDGLIADDGLIQIKCPIFSTQYDYLEKLKTLDGLTDNEKLYKLDSGYYKQMQFELFICNDRLFNVFYAYHPKLPAIRLVR